MRRAVVVKTVSSELTLVALAHHLHHHHPHHHHHLHHHHQRHPQYHTHCPNISNNCPVVVREHIVGYHVLKSVDNTGMNKLYNLFGKELKKWCRRRTWSPVKTSAGPSAPMNVQLLTIPPTFTLKWNCPQRFFFCFCFFVTSIRVGRGSEALPDKSHIFYRFFLIDFSANLVIIFLAWFLLYTILGALDLGFMSIRPRKHPVGRWWELEVNRIQFYLPSAWIILG